MEKDSYIFGLRAIQEAILSGQEMDKVFIQMGLQSHNYQEVNRLIQKKNIAHSFVPLEKLNQLSRNQNHQGLVARISPVAYVSLETLVENVVEKEEKPLFLLLDHITDTRNFGAIIRTAACTGVHGIIFPKTGSAPLSAAGIKTSAGAAFLVPLCKVNHLKDAIYYLQSSGIQIIGITEKTEQSVYEINYNQPTALIMGSEERGINPSILKLCDVTGKLPLLGEIDSLNVSVACGAVLYEVVRQRM
jgi:23S rRNA (guanosine2251-2'-O)-methyltransferase